LKARLCACPAWQTTLSSSCPPQRGTCSLVEQAGGRRARISATQLAQETGLPTPTVQKLVSKLTAAGLMRSSRGVGGGLRLARPPAAISLADIVEAVEGPIALAACIDRVKSDCTLEGCCNVKSHWPQVNAAVRGALAQVALTQLVEEV
jgi:Rrf2 family protein